jgi:hypothetical protein
MREGNVVVEKSFAFAIRIVNCYKYLVEEKKEHVLSPLFSGRDMTMDNGQWTKEIKGFKAGSGRAMNKDLSVKKYV